MVREGFALFYEDGTFISVTPQENSDKFNRIYQEEKNATDLADYLTRLWKKKIVVRRVAISF